MWKAVISICRKSTPRVSSYSARYIPSTSQVTMTRGFKQKNGFHSTRIRMAAHWGYRKPSVTPDKWNTLYPIADGTRQSPIDIAEKECEKEEQGGKLNLDYNPADITHAVNNGHSVTFVAEGENSVLTGGILKEPHRLLQFHFHWGSEDKQGSEHTLNGKEYSAEIHLVHLNTKYGSFKEALEHGDGLCVIGAFLEADDNGEEAYDKVAECVCNVKHKGQTYKIEGGLDARTLLPKNIQTFTTYDGSLTTPPLCECVQWVNVLEPVKISRKNLAAFRSLSFNEEGCGFEGMVDNYRAPQKKHSRKLCLHNHAA